MGRFFAEGNAMPRLLLALTGIVAIGVISIGIKDYVKHQKEAQPPASTHSPTVLHSNAITDPKKATSAKTGRARMPASEANAPATAEAAADDMEKPLISEEFAKAGAKVKADGDEVEAAKDRNNRVCYYPPPLPNGTKPADGGWASYY